MILAIDSSTDVCSVIVIANEKIKSKIETHLRQIHAEKLIFMINQAMENINTNLNSIDAIAISIGPGSFTGLRIGLSVAKGLCYALNKPLIAVPTLDALALKSKEVYEILQRYISEELYICSILNAKQDDFYYSFYKFKDGQLQRVSDYQVGSVKKIISEIPGKTILIGNGVEDLKDKHYNDNIILLSSDEFNYPDVYHVGLIALEKFNREEFAELASIEPLYIKKFVIKIK